MTSLAHQREQREAAEEHQHEEQHQEVLVGVVDNDLRSRQQRRVVVGANTGGLHALRVDQVRTRATVCRNHTQEAHTSPHVQRGAAQTHNTHTDGVEVAERVRGILGRPGRREAVELDNDEKVQRVCTRMACKVSRGTTCCQAMANAHFREHKYCAQRSHTGIWLIGMKKPAATTNHRYQLASVRVNVSHCTNGAYQKAAIATSIPGHHRSPHQETTKK